ncbi:MAG: phosphatase PAP2 family protein [Acidimicrobiia bacterium]
MTRTVRSLVAWAVWLFVGFLLVTMIVLAGWTEGFDQSINLLMVDWEIGWLVTASEVFHVVGSFPQGLIVAAVAAAVLYRRSGWVPAVTWLGLAGLANVLSTVTKELVGRERPVNGLVAETSMAYPSGHAMTSGAAMAPGFFLVAGLLWPDRRRPLLVGASFYALAMGLSRVYLRAHWMTDVIGGWLFGTAVACAVVAIASWAGLERSTDTEV